jgi:chromosome segregation ATPase
MQVSAQDSMHHEREVRELQNQLEQTRLDRDEWKRSYEKERALGEEMEVEVEEMRREIGLLKGAEEGVVGELEREREKARNLQGVLQDFQAGGCSLDLSG